MLQQRRRHELPQVGPVATALLNIPVVAAALAAIHLVSWLAQPEMPPAQRPSASPAVISVVEQGAVDESTSPAR
jgi:hypothetical protein